MNFISKVVTRIIAQSLRIARKNQAVQHQRIHWKQWPLFDDPAIQLRVAISNPALAISTEACEAVIVAAAPDRIGIEQPERRGISSGGEIDVDVRLFRTQFADQMNCRIKVAVEVASGNDLVGIAGSIKFELVHPVFFDQVEAGIAEI